MSSLPVTYLTPEQYLELERKAECRSEYVDGRMYQMGGASVRHGQIVGNTYAGLRPQLRRASCQAITNELRVRAKKDGPYYYPDLVIFCDNPQYEDNEFDTLLNPKIIIEVLSPSTEKYDRGKKFAMYRKIESLLEYVLISQDEPHVDHFWVEPGRGWSLKEASGLDGEIEFTSITAKLTLAQVYEDVEFTAAS